MQQKLRGTAMCTKIRFTAQYGRGTAVSFWYAPFVCCSVTELKRLEGVSSDPAMAYTLPPSTPPALNRGVSRCVRLLTAHHILRI